jgi:hypothetical protein
VYTLTTKILNKVNISFDSNIFLTPLCLNKDYEHEMVDK